MTTASVWILSLTTTKQVITFTRKRATDLKDVFEVYDDEEDRGVLKKHIKERIC